VRGDCPPTTSGARNLPALFHTPCQKRGEDRLGHNQPLWLQKVPRAVCSKYLGRPRAYLPSDQIREFPVPKCARLLDVLQHCRGTRSEFGWRVRKRDGSVPLTNPVHHRTVECEHLRMLGLRLVGGFRCDRAFGRERGRNFDIFGDHAKTAT
jgi:hypothetical protein